MFRFRFFKKNIFFKFVVIFSITTWFITIKYETINESFKKIQSAPIGNGVLIEFLSKIDAFFINIKLLNEIKQDFQLNNTNNNKYTLSYFLNKTNANLIFGVKEDFIGELNPSNLKNYGINCEIDSLYGQYIDKEVLTNVRMFCRNLTVHFAIFYKRGEYYWIGDGGKAKSNKWFGDVPRAMNFFDLKKLREINIPENLHQFTYDYKHSKFIECNRELANSNVELMGPEYKNNEKKENDFLFGLKHMRDFFEKNRKNYWIAAGTLLGWYRDCGLIPHTTDADFAMWSHDYNKNFKKQFLKDNNLRLGMTLGLINEAYELRFLSKTLKTFDLFLMYKANSTHQWNGYHTQKRLNKQWLPIFNETNLCSGELLNNKFIVPCNPEYYLSKQYGEGKWKLPLKSKYFNHESIKFSRLWTDEEWLYVVRRYNLNTHKIDVNKTLKAINAFLDTPLTELPPDNKNYEN